jgi:hypothetical protein
MPLMSADFIEALHTRIFEFDLLYIGQFQALNHLKKVFSQFTFNQDDKQCSVAAFAHMLLKSSYSSNVSSEDQLVKLVFKIKPSVAQMQHLLSSYRERCDELAVGVSWAELQEDAATPAGDAKKDSVYKLYGRTFEECEREIQRVMTAAGMKIGSSRCYRVSNIRITRVSAVLIKINCSSNCHASSKGDEQFYIFKNSYTDAEQPLYCFKGASKGHVPIVVASAVQLQDEMREAGLAAVDMPQLTVLISHGQRAQGKRNVKAE